MPYVSHFKVKSPGLLIASFLSLLFVFSFSTPALAAGVSQNSVQANWPMFGYNLQHTHNNPNETLLSPSTVSKLVLDWSYQGTAPILGPTTVANGVAYIGSEDSYLYAFDTSSGAILWKFKTQNVVQDAPAVVNGTIYFGSVDGNVYALNSSNGALLWSFKTGGFITESSPAVANGVVYIGSNDSYVYALNATTGALIWSYKTGANITSSPAVVNGVVYIGAGFYLSALDSAAGTLKWQYNTKGQLTSSPAVANGVVYIGDQSGSVYAVNSSTGTLKWSVDALKATTGASLWNYGIPDETQSSPTVVNGMVFIGTLGHWVYAFHLPM